MASGDAVEQIKNRLGIVDVISQYVELHQAGKNMKGKSPFTSEKTPSFYVSPDRGMYYCFSSSQGGDMFTFVEKMEGVDFKGALKILADKAGVELVPQDPQKKTERDRQFDVLEAVTLFYGNWLQKKPAAMEYLTARGVTPQTIAKWRVGYAPGPDAHGWREAKQYLEGKGYTADELTRTGIIKGGDQGKEPYDVFRDRVMFPICDASGRVVGFSGRILTADTEAPKYVNSPETELFNKSEVLFGYDKAKQAIRSMDFSLIVEGQFDVIMSHQAGYNNTVAVSGTALTPHHVGLLQRLSNRVVLALDNDRAGIAAVKRAAELMLARGMDVKVARMEGGKDPADMIVADPHAFKQCIGHAHHVIEYLLDILKDEAKDERTFKLRARDEILPFVIRIPSQIDRDHFESIIAEKIQTSKEAVRTEVQRMEQKLASEAARGQEVGVVDEPPATSTKPTGTKERMQRQREELLGYLIALTDIFDGPVGRKVHEVLYTVTGQETEALRAKLSPEIMSQLIFSLEEELSSIPKAQLRNDVAHQATQFAARTFKVEKSALDEALRAAEQAGKDPTEVILQIDRLRHKFAAIRYQAEDFE